MTILISDKISQKSVETLKSAGFTIIYEPEITSSDLKNKIADCDGLIVRSRTKVTQDIIEAGKQLKIIGRVGSGIDNIDKKSADEKGIAVVNAPDANSIAVAELTIGLIITLLRHIPKAVTSMREGLWMKKELQGLELSGKTVGIVGYGNIGKKVGEVLKVAGCKLLVFSRSYKTVESLDELFSKSDIISLHVGLTDETRGMITKELLDKMKPTGYFLNLSRAEVVDGEALYGVLQAGKIAGSAMDVYPEEPLPSNSKWRTLSNVLLTPHIGASTHEAMERASEEVVKQVIKFFKLE